MLYYAFKESLVIALFSNINKLKTPENKNKTTDTFILKNYTNINFLPEPELEPENAETYNTQIKLEHSSKKSKALPNTLKYLKNYLEKSNPDPENTERTKNGIPIKDIRPVVENFLKELIKNNEFCRQGSEKEDILSNIMNEHFKNQFETGISSGGFLGFERRMSVEKQVFGIPEKIVNSMLGEKIEINKNDNGSSKYKFQGGNKFEKYGYLDKEENISTDVLDYYGPIKFVFKKDSLKGKTTMTFGDSLICLNKVIASKITDPKIESIPGVLYKHYSQLELLYRLIKNNEIKATDNAMDVVKTFDRHANKHKNNTPIEYIELQFHGKLTKNDIAECIIPSYTQGNIETILRTNKIPIRKY